MKSVKRLYTELKPSHYTLDITPDLKTMTFDGMVTIRLQKTGRPSQRLTFHQNGLKVTHADVVKYDKRGNGQNLTIARINNQDTLNEVRIHTVEPVYSGSYSVTLTFTGNITRNMTGLYPNYFKMHGEEHVLLATQFESHYARELFPCIDEPEAKATFDLTIVAPSDMTALANTPPKSQEPIPGTGLSRTTFETTPKMSTYLLAFVIGDLQSVSTTTKRGTEVSVWATIAQPLAALDFALDCAKRSVEFFEDYFGVPYPLPKLDHVGLPDFASGAMENWGLITYRERLLVAYPGETSQSIREYIAMVIAHETSHQWFGNLVTMKWWDDLWLNESFANMMEFQAVDAMFPEWHIWESFIMGEGLSSLRRDATAGVQAVRTSVHHPDEINTLFDPSIVYAKGGRLLYMLKNYIGEDAFRRGLSAYFKKHAYSNTSGNDLWQALGEASGQDISAFMTPWLEQSGFPVVTVDQLDGIVELKQAHFLEGGQDSDGRIWPAPLFANHSELPKRLDTASLRNKLLDGEPLIINKHAAGHYIVNYANAEHRARLIDLVSRQALETPDRLMLLNYAIMLSRAGYQSLGDALVLLEAYRSEEAEPVWGVMAMAIGEARRFIDLDESLEEPIKAFVRTLIAREYGRLGWKEREGESASDSKLRGTIIGLGAYAEEPAIIETALKQFAQYRDHDEPIVPELRSIVFGVAVKQKVEGAFDWLVNLHDTTPNSDLKADISAALASTRETAEADILLGRLTNPSLIKPQDADHWLVYLLRNRYSRQNAWRWMEDNWDWIMKTYYPREIANFPRYAASACNTQAMADKYEAFFTPMLDELVMKRNIEIGLNEIRTRVAWLDRDLPSVQAFFK